jgi:hypothetical protein
MYCSPSVLKIKNWIYWSEANYWIYFYINLNKNWKIYWSEQNFSGLGGKDRCSSWGLHLVIHFITRKNCFRYLKLMSPLNAAICTTISYTLWVEWHYLKTFIWPWDQSPTKVIMVRDTPPYGHAPTYQISLTYLERQKFYGLDKKIIFKKHLFDLEVKVPWRSLRYATHRLMVMHPHTKYNSPIWKDKKVMVRKSFTEKKQKKRKKKSD